VKADSKQLNEMMARCLAGECSPEELVSLKSMLSENPELKTDYEVIKLLFGKEKNGIASPDKKHFNRIRKRLEDEGSM
jgi:hypothetical protein